MVIMDVNDIKGYWKFFLQFMFVFLYWWNKNKICYKSLMLFWV